MNNISEQGSRISRTQRIFRVAFTCGWAGLIFYLSTGTFGGRFSGILLSNILHILHIHVTPPTFALLHHLFRKAAHLTEYCIFALLIFASIQGRDDLYWELRTAVWSVILAGAYSLTDEFHQMFVPGRGPSLVDCGIDTSAAIIAMLLIWIVSKARQASRERRQVTVSAG